MLLIFFRILWKSNHPLNFYLVAGDLGLYMSGKYGHNPQLYNSGDFAKEERATIIPYSIKMMIFNINIKFMR